MSCSGISFSVAGRHTTEFKSGKLLRSEAEGKFGRRLSASEWTLVDSDGSFDRDAPYDEHDLVDLLAFMTKRLPPKTIPRPDRERAQARAHVHEVATRVKGLVANERQRLFGAPDPPFKDAAQAAKWIESQVTPQETSRLTISVELPAAELGFGLLRALRDWLDRTLPATDDEVGFAEVMRGAVGLRTIKVGTDVLPYLPAVDASVHEVGVRRVYVQYGSRLGAVREAAERIAAATGWEVLAAVHHLLTGGEMASPVRTTHRVHASREGTFQQTATIEVPHPESVGADTVARAYTAIRKRGPGRRQRARTLNHDRIVAFVQEHAGMTWPALLEEWNRAYPNSVFKSDAAMRRAYDRATKRS